MVGFEKALGAVKVIKDQIQYRSQSLLNLARDYFRSLERVLSSLKFVDDGVRTVMVDKIAYSSIGLTQWCPLFVDQYP